VTEFIIILILSLIKTGQDNEGNTDLGDEDKFGFILRFFSTFIFFGILNILSGGIPESWGNIFIYIIISMFIFVFAIPISILLLKLLFKIRGT